MYKVAITARAEKELRKTDRHIRNRIAASLRELITDPRPPGYIPIKSEPGAFRIRIGDWRVGYVVDDVNKSVTIFRIAHRREFYE